MFKVVAKHAQVCISNSSISPIFYCSYRNLLDSWRLWTQRAHFDIALSARNETEKPPQQVFVSCNFCGKSISAFMQGRGRGLFARVPNKSKVCKVGRFISFHFCNSLRNQFYVQGIFYTVRPTLCALR